MDSSNTRKYVLVIFSLICISLTKRENDDAFVKVLPFLGGSLQRKPRTRNRKEEAAEQNQSKCSIQKASEMTDKAQRQHL